MKPKDYEVFFTVHFTVHQVTRSELHRVIKGLKGLIAGIRFPLSIIRQFKIRLSRLEWEGWEEK